LCDAVDLPVEGVNQHGWRLRDDPGGQEVGMERLVCVEVLAGADVLEGFD